MNKDEIKADLHQMFWEPAIDYASKIAPITYENDEQVLEAHKEWEKIHKAYAEGVKDVLDFIFSNYDVKKLEVSKVETPEEREIRIQREIDYNNFCARATLYPGKSSEEVLHMQKIERIEAAYKFVNDVLCNNTLINDQKTRRWVIEKLQGRLPDSIAKCDEENNPPEVIDQNILVARLMWNSDYSKTFEVSYCDMIFGDKAAVEKFQNQTYFDNENYKFIQKGI